MQSPAVVPLIPHDRLSRPGALSSQRTTFNVTYSQLGRRISQTGYWQCKWCIIHILFCRVRTGFFKHTYQCGISICSHLLFSSLPQCMYTNLMEHTILQIVYRPACLFRWCVDVKVAFPVIALVSSDANCWGLLTWWERVCVKLFASFSSLESWQLNLYSFVPSCTNPFSCNIMHITFTPS